MYKTELHIPVTGQDLPADLVLPENPKGIVLFSHGSGSSRRSPRNRFVAEVLQQNGFATLMFDLLTENEDRTYENRFNIELLSSRLIEVTEHVMGWPETKDLSVGYFGASTGAAAAISAAAFFGKKIRAIVSRGGRPDLALSALKRVKAPTLLIIGGLDMPVISMNRQAFTQLQGIKEMQIIQGATHLFEEPGKLEQVAESSAKWFSTYLRVPEITENIFADRNTF
jgi:putative phosphoribosyl transferase